METYYKRFISPGEKFFDDIYYRAKVNAYSELNKQLNPNLEYNVFLGDSLIEQFPVEEIYSRGNVLNRGIGFDTTVGALKRYKQNVNNINVLNCFLMIGYNDLKYRSIDETYENIKNILFEIRAKKKYFISILPCDNTKYNEDIRKLNVKIQTFANNNNIEYIDCYHLFIRNDGRLKSEYYYDGVHLNISGYLIVNKVIEPHIYSVNVSRKDI